jgi:hypothetical protein
VRSKPLTFNHYGKPIRLTPDASIVRAVTKLKAPKPAKQPAGRAPARRGVTRARRA